MEPLPLEETRTPDGWVFGVVSAPPDGDECSRGIAFVEAPCGTRAGLLWRADDGPPQLTLTAFPDRTGWGVYTVTFGRAVRSRSELVEELQFWLPDLAARYRDLM